MQGVKWETLNAEVLSLYRQGQYKRATEVAKKALKVAEQAGGLHHPTVALSMNNLAACYCDQGRYAQAEPLYQRALTIREKTLGPNHPAVAQSLEGLALLYRMTAREEAAVALEKRVTAIRASRFRR